MNIIITDIDKIELLEKISKENIELTGCPFITHADLRCFYGIECRREKCNFLFHDIRSCKKKYRYYCNNQYCQFLHADDAIDKFQLIIDLSEEKKALLVPIIYEYL